MTAPPIGLSSGGATEHHSVVLPLVDLNDSCDVAAVLDDGSVALRGSRCASCAGAFFPARELCPVCAAVVEPEDFGPDGVLYSYTTVMVSSTMSVPYTIGYVDLAQGPRVLAPIHVDHRSELAPDLPGALEVTPGGGWIFRVHTNARVS